MAPTRVAPTEENAKGTLYQRTLYAQQYDEQWQKDVTMGTRVGFYRFKSEIGNGNFSHVRLAFHQLTKERVAIKILDKLRLDHKTNHMLNREITIMEGLQHPNIIRLYEVVETLTRIHLVMEYAGGGELFAKITTQGKFPEPEARHVFAQVVSAVHYLHQRNIIHRDLKAENVFFSSPSTVKLGDFGFSTSVSTPDHLLNTFCGSPPYAAPELFRDESYEGPPVDLWALGILLYFLVTATMPFCAQTVASLKKLILYGDFTIPDFLSKTVHLLIVKLLQPIPKNRLSLNDVIASDWLKDEKSLRNGCEAVPALEDKAKSHLKRIGIDEELLTQSLLIGQRNAIVGTYCILLYRCQKEAMQLETADEPGGIRALMSPEDECKKNNGRRKLRWSALKIGNFLNNFKNGRDSKICTIL